ncbi:RNA polymerase sigma factor [Candidatus Fermentibacteria bacterium]|nr:RNA polymerase sigma factor [Candidatus Fermentibacteria bacterium]
MISEPSRLRVIESARAGDRKAFSELVSSYSGFVYSLARRLVGDPEDAEDIAQEVFVKAWLNLGLMRDCSSFPSWLAAIARRASVDHLRKRHGRTSLGGEDIDDLGVSDPPPDTGIDPGLERAMSALPERDRALLTMVYFGEFTHAEAGEVLGIPENSVRVYLLRARRRLRSLLEGRENELLQQIG